MLNPKKPARGRLLFWTGAGVLLALVLAYAFKPAPVPVDLGIIEAGPMTVHVRAEGRTRVRDIFVVSAPVSGRVLRIEAEAGDTVEADKSVLAVIEPADPAFLDARTRTELEAAVQATEDALAQAQSERDRAAAELSFANSELKRARTLIEKGTISQRDLDRAELSASTAEALLNSAEATVKVRSHELETARARLMRPGGAGSGDGECCITILAPATGRVLRVLHESESVIAAGTPLMEVGDPAQLEAVVDLLTTDAARIREGAIVSVENWGGPQLQGRVRRIEPYGYTKVSVLGIEEQRVDVIIDFASPPEDGPKLAHGFRVEAAIEEWSAGSVVQAPLSALFRVAGGWAVYKEDDGIARLTMIEAGRMNGRVAEVRSGLNPGERVVLHPGVRVADGAAIEPRD